MPRPSLSAFTIAELLIALAILGVLATFAIPKVLQSQQDSKWKSIAKEAAATITEAATLYRYRDGFQSSTTARQILDKYLNYIAVDTGGSVDSPWGARDCSTSRCYLLANGAIIHFINNDFGNTTPLNAVYMYVDPDGRQSSVGAVGFWLYYDGKLRNYEAMEPSTDNGGNIENPCPNCDPDWFSWN